MAFIALPLFSKSVDSLEHEDVKKYREILEEMADAYECKLIGFAIKEGVVFFSFDNDEVVADILKDIEEVVGRPPEMCESIDEFINKSKGLFK